MSHQENFKLSTTGVFRSVRRYAADEFKRAPIATLSILIGAIGGCLTFIMAGITPLSESQILLQSSNANIDSVGTIEIKNIFMVLSFFLFSSFLGAGIVRVISKKHDIASILLSILIASTTNFLTILIIFLAPPRARSEQLFYAAHDNVFYASMIVYLTVCGTAVFRDIYQSAAPASKDRSLSIEKKESDSMGFIFLSVVLVAMWGWIVFAGQKNFLTPFCQI
jgi:hypothetical protein